MNTLDQWELDAKAATKTKYTCDQDTQFVIDLFNDRVVALIDLTRKKDAVLIALKVWFRMLKEDQEEKLIKPGLKAAIDNWENLEHQSFDFKLVEEAIALTEELK